MLHKIFHIFSWIENKCIEWISLDYRSLALLRITMGSIIIADLIQRATSLFAHYDDLGTLTRVDILKYWNNEWWISLHMASGMWQWQALLFIIAGIFALMLILGYRTRLAMIVSWFLLVSLHARNPLILQGGDVVFRVVLFWMMFLPLGARWSLDRLFNRIPPPKEKTTWSAGTVGYIVQICLLYIFTGILKTGDAWHVYGTATYQALSIDQLITPVGGFVLTHFGSVLPYLTWFVLYVEIYGSILLFMPFLTAQFRILGIILFAILQIGFNIDMRLGLFGAIAIGSTLGLLPSYFWDTILGYWHTYISQKALKGLKIYYDGDCTFCAKIVYGLKKFLLLHPDTVLAPGYIENSVLKEMEARTSWVIVDSTGSYTYGYAGFITILSYTPHLKWLAKILSFFMFRFLGDKIYRYVSLHRLTVCQPLIIKTQTYVERIINTIIQAIILSLVLYVVLWNVDGLGKTKYINTDVEWIAWVTRLDQKFDMFAPTPLLEDGWYVFPGHLRDGTEIDVFRNGAPVHYSKPHFSAYEYKDQRWQKYLMNLWAASLAQFRDGYGKYLCREWNKTHTDEKQLVDFKMIFMVEKTPVEPTDPQEPVAPTTIWEHRCF